jgi:ketol-acid reductoisomerase
MNVVISDTAEYGCYLFNHAAVPMLRDYVNAMSSEYLGAGLKDSATGVDNLTLIAVNEAIRETAVEYVGAELRGYMTDMKSIVEA